MKYIFIFASFLLTASCVTGPETEKKSPLNYLNGEHYAQSGANPLNTIPFITRKKVLTEISGTLVVKSKPIFLNLGNQKIVIFDKNDNEVARTQSNSVGYFSIKASIKNGTYSIRMENNKYKLDQKLIVTKFKHDKLNLIAEYR